MLRKIRSAGFSLRLDGECLVVSPWSKLSGDQRNYIKDNKAELVGMLVAEQDLRRKVLQQLADNPDTKYAIAIDDLDTDPIIVGFGVRHKAVCNLAIPKVRFDAAELQRAIEEMAAEEIPADLSRAVAETVEVFGS